MDASLLDRLDACCVFVVGKGGVGKTTTAGALALALADRGLATHLISTDPAHSLGDVFGIDAAGGAAIAGVCSTPLTIEEFSADGYARGPFRGLVEGLAELAERGTYLEEAEVRTFVDLQLPGVDEVMAALRLAELADSAARVVVDTAPTGHTLCLLDAGAVVGSWVAAFRAMAEKASVVASRLVRRPVRLTGEAAVDALEEAVGRFERAVLGRAAFVVVGTGEPAVEAETGRLIAGLERRGLRVALRVHRGAGAPAGAVVTPAAASPRGCAALRELAGALRTGPAAAWKAPAPGPARPGDGADGGPLLPVFRRELLFFVGKGGVGKSTCAAASALALAAERPVALCGVDPAGSLGDVLGIEPSSGGREVVPGLLVRQVDAGAELARLREEYRRDVAVLFERFGLDEAAALDRRVVEAFWNLAPPGLDELLALATLLDAAGTDRTLVVDAAPTGHFLRLMEMPDVALEWVHASMRLLLRHRAITGLDGVAERLLRLARELRALRDRLVDPTRTGVYVVTLDEPLVRRETERLRAALGRAGLPEAAVIRNRVDGGGEAPAAADGITIAAPLLSPPPGGPDALRDFFARWGPT